MKNVRQADVGKYPPPSSLLLCVWGQDGDRPRGRKGQVWLCVCAHACVCVRMRVCVCARALFSSCISDFGVCIIFPGPSL